MVRRAWWHGDGEDRTEVRRDGYGTVYQLSYMTALLFQADAKVPGATSFDPAEPFIAGVFAVAAALLLSGLRSAPREGHG